MQDELDLLIAKRTGGAVNIRGVRYQILFSVLKSLEMFCNKESSTFVRLEGIEDVDLIGLHDEFIQVKTAKESWKWNQLKEPLQRFFEVYRQHREVRFTLQVDFTPEGEMAKLAAYSSLNSRDQMQVRQHFTNLCKSLGVSAEEAASLLTKLSISSLSEAELLLDLRRLVTKAFGLGTNAVDIYLLALVAQHLTWAKERKTVLSSDIADFWLQIGQDLGREEEFQAVGKGLIEEVSWIPDASLADFLDGKGTRPGHIAGNIDVVRSYWLDRIDEALQSISVCVIRGSSGQGKSTLLYRYAYDRWPSGQVLLLHAVQSLDQVQLIRSHLELRVRLGQVPLVLIDNIGTNTRYWSDVSAECARLGIRVLVSIRQEDWGRFVNRTATNYEVVEPYLNLVEARQVFEVLKTAGRIHSSVDSAEQSFERVGSPALFMEFVSLITQGRMLQERLRDQVAQFKHLEEDPAKVEVIRRVTLAHMLGVPLLIEPLMDGLSFAREDPGQVLRSLLGEYLSLEDDRVTGLHQVRSGHLVRLLHDGYPSPTHTAIACIPLIPPSYVQVFVANALASPDIDSQQIERYLIAWLPSEPLNVYLHVLDGYFEAGERAFLEQTHDLFDDVFKRGGENLLFVVRSELLPTAQVDILTTMINILGERGQQLREYQGRLAEFRELPRGIDRVREFLGNSHAEITSSVENASAATLGQFLDWCGLTSVSIPYWNEVQGNVLEVGKKTWSSVQAVAQFAQGLYRYDQETYAAWLAAHRQTLFEYLEFELDCIDLHVGEDIVTVRFLVGQPSQLSPNEEAVSRLEQLRSIFPFAEEYQSRGHWMLPSGLSPSVDETIKTIPQRNLHLRSDVAKNVMWGNIIDSRYVDSSYYQVLQTWHAHRHLALQIVKGLVNSLGNRRAANGTLPIDPTPPSFAVYTEFERASRHIPSLPPQAPKTLFDNGRRAMSTWTNSFQGFLSGLLQVAAGKSAAHSGARTFHLFQEAKFALGELHDVCADLFRDVPDYFDSQSLNEQEIRMYQSLSELLNAWLIHPPAGPHKHMRRYAATLQASLQRKAIAAVGSAILPLRDQGLTFVLPTKLVQQKHTQSFPLGFSVTNPCRPLEDLFRVIETLNTSGVDVDWFCLVPLLNGRPLPDLAYNISSRTMKSLSKGEDVGWENFVPQPASPEVFEALGSPQVIQDSAFDIQRRIVALVTGIPVVQAVESLMQSKSNGSSEWSIKSHERDVARCHTYRGEYIALADSIKQDLAEYSATCESEQVYLSVIEQVTVVREHLTGSPLGELEVDMTSLEDRSERLLCHNYPSVANPSAI